MQSDDAEAIKAATETLMQASHKLAEQLYAQKGGQGGPGEPGAGPQAGPGAGAGAHGAGPGGADEDVVDADYTEVK